MIRLTNLVAIPPSPRSVAMVRSTLGEAVAHPELGGWPFLDDVTALVDAQDNRLLTGLPGV